MMKNRIGKVKKMSNNQGITLIALVISIVVLLILAGVSIATLTGENGILTQAQNSKTASEKGEAEDRINLVVNEWQIEKNRADAKDLETFLNSKVTSGEIDRVTKNADGTFTVEVNEYSYILNADGILTIKPGERAKTTVKDNYTDGTKTATIPAGYTVSNIDGEKTIDGGLVIYEIPEGITVNWTAKNADGIYQVQTLYNQFVWIPATESSYVRNTTYANTIVSTTAYTDKDYLPSRIQPTISNELITNLSSENAETSLNAAQQIGMINENAEKTAVLKAGGFYISRYEAGKETVNGVEQLVSKKGANVWVSIQQETAKTTVKNANNSYALCSGIQWDVTMAFVNGKPDGANPQQTFDVTKSSSARHIGGSSVAKSGQNEADRVANIYDLEGNAYERVAENTYGSNNPYNYRGGNYYSNSLDSCRGGYDGLARANFSFRFTLYVM